MAPSPSRLSPGLVVYAVVMSALFAACSQDEIGAAMVRKIATEITESSGIDVDDLEIRWNPHGEGAVVFVAPPSKPLVAWVVLRGHPYALNDITRDVAPGIPPLAEAPATVVVDFGAGRELSIESVVETMLVR